MGLEEEDTLGSPGCFTSKISCMKGSNIPIDKTEKTIERKIVTKYQPIEALYRFK